MPVDLHDLQRRARAAYERGRLRRALFDAWPVLGLAAIALWLGSRPWRVVAVAVVLYIVAVIALHRGRAIGRAVLPGLLGGSLPMLAGLLSCRLPHGCMGPGCMRGCMLVCLVAAAIGGAFVAHRCRAISRHDREPMLVGATVAALAGGLGCIIVGTAGLFGLALGLGIVAVPALVLSLARAR